jgi:sortase A
LAIAGHRTTFGAPFARINELQSGDSIEIETAEGTYTYIVTSSPRVVPATAVEVAQTLDPSKTSLTLITCHPKWSSKDRLIVEANIDASPVAKTVATYPSTNDSTPQLTRGWFDDSSAWPNVLGLIGLLVALFVMTQFLARRYRYTWLIYTVALLAFLPSLLLLFSQISRLLPNNF